MYSYVWVQMPTETSRGHQIPSSGSYMQVWATQKWCWDSNLGPLQVQCLHLAPRPFSHSPTFLVVLLDFVFSFSFDLYNFDQSNCLLDPLEKQSCTIITLSLIPAPHVLFWHVSLNIVNKQVKVKHTLHHLGIFKTGKN